MYYSRKSCFFNKDSHIVSRLVDEEVLDQPLPSRSDLLIEPIIQAEYEANNAPEVKEWIPWDYHIKQGQFYALGDDLCHERGHLLKMGRSSKVTLSSSKKKPSFTASYQLLVVNNWMEQKVNVSLGSFRRSLLTFKGG